MHSSSREDTVEVFDALKAAMKRALDLSFDALTTPECLTMLECCETLRRQLPAVEHPLINQLGAQANDTELGGTLRFALADRLRITPAEASRRIHDAENLGERRAITGEPLEPVLPATAAAQRAGQIGAGHVAVIRSFSSLRTCRALLTPRPASTPRRIWPGWPASTAPTTWPSWPPGSPTA